MVSLKRNIATLGKLLCGIGAAGFFISPVQAVTLASHRAIYDLETTRLDSGSGYTSVQGRLAYELTGSSCDGWAVNYRIANRYVQPEKGEQLLDTQLTTWESGDGLEMNLSQKQFIDSSLDSEERLNVKRPKSGSEAKGVMTLPKELDFTVSPEAVFPSTHQARLLEEAKEGKTHDVSLVFDGSDGEKTYKAISFIGKKREPGSFALDVSNPQTLPLRGIPSWPMTVSYYPADDSAEIPVYQASFNMYENGVSTDLILDYGSYALKGTLTRLDMLKTDVCK
jgi:hypothetical protein